MGKISLGELNRSLLFILLMSLSMVFNQYIYGFIYIECFYNMNIYRILYNAIIDDKKTDFPHHRIFDPFFSYIGVFLISIFLPKENKKTEIIKNEDEESDDLGHRYSSIYIPLIHNSLGTYLKERKGRIFYIFVLILWVAEENLLLIYVDIFQDLDFWFFELIFISIIFSKIFVFKIYSHQKLAMALSICIGSILKIYNITLSFEKEIQQDEKNKKFYSKYPLLCFFALFYLLLIITRSYVNTQIKIFMDLKYISHRTLLMSYGITGAVMCLVFGIFTSLVPCFSFIHGYVCKINYGGEMYFDEIRNYLESGMNMLVRAIVIILGIITFFFNKYYCTLIIKLYTPIHVIFSFPIQYFIEKNFLLVFTSIFFRNDLFTEENQLEKFLLDVSGDIISIFGFLIYLEIIELNFCKLNYNLKKNISARSEHDYRFSLGIENESEKIKDDTSSLASSDSEIEY